MKRLGLTLLLTAIAFLSWAGLSAEELPPEHPVLTVTQWTTNWEQLQINVENPSQESQSGKLVVWYIFRGDLAGIAFDLTVPAETTYQITIDFPWTPLVGDVKIYTDIPDGVNEDPDPIAEIKVVDPED
jgi:hypothetical protein